MFTGIIEEVGTIVEADPLQGGRAFVVGAETVLDGLTLGDSVSIDGACHTVAEIRPGAFTVQSVATTLQRTALGDYGIGRRVNLERALQVGQRLGGHFVQGHVDAVGRVVTIVPHGEHVLIDFTLPPEVEAVTIHLGSITLNGVSLTVNALPAPGLAQVSVIPHTWAVTALSELCPEINVNLEGDLLGKYVRHLLGERVAAVSRSGS